MKIPLFNSRYSKNILRGFRIQLNVIQALIYRELKTRISEVKFGFVGVFIEPIGVMIIFLFIFGLIRGRGSSNIPIALFLTCGIVLFTMFSDIAIRSLNARQANLELFFYKPVKPIDTVLSRAVVESCLYAIVFIVLWIGIALLRENFLLDNLILFVFSFLLLSITATGVGITLMTAGHIYPFLNQVVPFLLRPMWIVSGVFFSLNNIPQGLRPYLSWNPILQAIELSRYSISSNYILNEAISLPYLVAIAFGSLTFGLWIYTNNERNLLSR